MFTSPKSTSSSKDQEQVPIKLSIDFVAYVWQFLTGISEILYYVCLDIFTKKISSNFDEYNVRKYISVVTQRIKITFKNPNDLEIRTSYSCLWVVHVFKCQHFRGCTVIINDLYKLFIMFKPWYILKPCSIIDIS